MYLSANMSTAHYGLKRNYTSTYFTIHPQVMGVVFLILILSTSAAASDLQVILRESATFPLFQTYDYIVVGGGSAGCSLAATLSKDFKVLLLERGGSPYGNPNITRRDNFGANYINQGTDTPTQAFVSTEGVPNARARILGGGTSINVGFYNRASPQEVSDLGLDGKLANVSFRWVERILTSVPILGPYQRGFRTSLLQAGLLPDNGISFDFQVGTQTGGSTFDNQGNRRLASDLFVYAVSKNIDVLLHAEVQLVLLQGSPPRASGVRFTDGSGRQRTALLNGKLQSEVILSAGTLGSPQLLLLSGIGPANELRAMGIRVNVDLPGVGRNVSDNPAAVIAFPSPSPVESSLVQVAGVTALSGNYIEAASGQAVIGLSNSQQSAFVIEKVSRPLSQGMLTLRTQNVRDNPLVTFNYFSDLRDLQLCIDGVNRLEEVVLADAFRTFVFENQSLPSGGTVGAPNRRNPGLAASVNATIAIFCRQNLITIWHYHGGCLKGKVLDSSYRVLGTRGLRVVDGSTLNFSPGTNPQATILMLGRYVGVQILKSRT